MTRTPMTNRPLRALQAGALWLSAALLSAGLLGCAGTPVALGSRVSGSPPSGPSRTITAEACGFQLLLFIPIAVNDRMARAYRALEDQAAGAFITDVKVQERWGYGLVGTSYCTALEARAIGHSSR